MKKTFKCGALTLWDPIPMGTITTLKDKSLKLF